MPIHSANRSRHRESFPAPPSPALYRNIAYTFVGVTVIIVVAALWFSSVKATVTVKAVREPVAVEATVDVKRNPGQGQLPGRVVQGVFEKIQEFETGKTVSKSENAIVTGKVRIINNYSKSQPLVKTTRLLTSDGRLYRISETVNVPAGGTVDVEAYSDKPGTQFEFIQKTKFLIPGLAESLQKLIYAESVSAFESGSMTINILTQEDVDTARTQLEASVLEQAKQTLYAEVADARLTESVYLSKPIESKSNILVGEEADRFLLSVKLDVTGVFYSRADMEALVKERIGQRVPDGREVVSYNPEKTAFAVNQSNATDESASLTVKAEVLTKLSEASPNLPKELILGLPIDEAEAKLEAEEGIEQASITVRPNWVHRLPTQKDHITFRVE